MSLYEFDAIYWRQGYSLLCGVDEAGRGPLAGPVYAAAVILSPDGEIEGLRDSKMLTPKRREKLFEEIREHAIGYCIASAGPEEIDAINILQASLLAMRRAVEGLSITPDLLLVDGNADPQVNVDTCMVVKGDTMSASIAAASILAKVARDCHLLELDQKYPQYRFAQHKGYPTKLHYEMLDTYGPSPIHRETFLRKWRASKV